MGSDIILRGKYLFVFTRRLARTPYDQIWINDLYAIDLAAFFVSARPSISPLASAAICSLRLNVEDDEIDFILPASICSEVPSRDGRLLLNTCLRTFDDGLIMSVIEFSPASLSQPASLSWKNERQQLYFNPLAGIKMVEPHGTASMNARCLLCLKSQTGEGSLLTQYALTAMDKHDRIVITDLPTCINAYVPLDASDLEWTVYLDPRTNALLCHRPRMEDSIGKWVDIYYPV